MDAVVAKDLLTVQRAAKSSYLLPKKEKYSSLSNVTRESAEKEEAGPLAKCIFMRVRARAESSEVPYKCTARFILFKDITIN